MNVRHRYGCFKPFVVCFFCYAWTLKDVFWLQKMRLHILNVIFEHYCFVALIARLLWPVATNELIFWCDDTTIIQRNNVYARGWLMFSTIQHIYEMLQHYYIASISTLLVPLKEAPKGLLSPKIGQLWFPPNAYLV